MENKKITVSIDGRQGSGKSTAAVAIARALYAVGFNVIVEDNYRESFADQPIPVGFSARIVVEQGSEP